MLDLLKDLWGFMKARKKFWLAPIIVMLLLLGALIVLSQGSAVAPFIYTLFWKKSPRIVGVIQEWLAILLILDVRTRGFDIVSGKGFFSGYRNQVAYPEMMYVW